MTDALFQLDTTRVRATEFSRGPWDDRHCHGGPVTAVLARAVLRMADGDDWQIARLTIELLRPVPVMTAMSLSTAVERPGRKVSLVGAMLHEGDVEVARLRALRIRRHPLELPQGANLAADVPLKPASSVASQRTEWVRTELTAFHTDGAEHRFVEGSWDEPGPVGVWIRLLVPVVEGEQPSGVERVAAAADFGNGVSGSLPYEDFIYINPDLTVHVLRPPVGEWIGMRTTSYYGPLGAGLAESELFDVDGRLGRSCQSLFVDAR